jgi:NAD(P)-dependent dehydrogenase (short-subunit alcohol dehydrogenase family)
LPLAPFRSAYSASKHALNALTSNLRVELRDEFPDIHVSSVHPGVVATEFGLKSLHGGFDSRRIPGAQSAQDVAAVIADLITSPRADVYTRPGARDTVARYYADEDMARAEAELVRPVVK